jgi:lipopolysaccharide export LptBFGC system permease protein LptF
LALATRSAGVRTVRFLVSVMLLSLVVWIHHPVTSTRL